MEFLKFVFKRKLPEHQISTQNDHSTNVPMTEMVRRNRQSHQNSSFFSLSKGLKFYDSHFRSSRNHHSTSNVVIDMNGSANDESIQVQTPAPEFCHARQQHNLHASRPSEQYVSDTNITHGRENSAPQAPVVPLTSHPAANSPQKSSEIYRHHLLISGRGSPLWIPEPSNTLPLEYQRAGVGIGDVIILTASGGTDFLFNIYHPKGDSERSINPSTMPKGYIPLDQPHIRDISNYVEPRKNSFIASPLVTRHDEESSALIFDSSGTEGAILIMPNGANSTDLKATMPLHHYAHANAEQWYKYANEVRGRDVRNGDIRLVVGKTSTNTWGMAAIQNDSEEGVSHLKFMATGIHGSGMVPPTHKWEYFGKAEVKCGPDSHEVEKLRGDDADGGDGQQNVYENQCLFVRTINITLQADVWDTLMAEWQRLNLDEDEGAPPGSTSAGNQTGTQAGVVFSQRRSVHLSSSPSSLGLHPSKIVNQFLLNQRPYAKMAITEDNDWISVLEKNDKVFPAPNTLISRLSTMYDISDEGDVVSLKIRDLPIVPMTSRLPMVAGASNFLGSVSEDTTLMPQGGITGESLFRVGKDQETSDSSSEQNIYKLEELKAKRKAEGDKRRPQDNHEPHSNNGNTPWKCHERSEPNLRNLVVCIDGTSNQFGEKNTNVVELYRLIQKEVGDKQLAWYTNGIGSPARPSWMSLSYFRQVIDHEIDLAIAWNFERNIFGAYKWLSDNYQEGDRIFLFGFSRGAFQVRVLAAMINKVGLLREVHEQKIPYAYQHYAAPKSGPLADTFKTTFCRDADVHFVGTWDTVSSIGWARKRFIFPGTIDGMKHVCYFRHALALDERRVKFAPVYAYGGSSTGPPESNAAQPNGTTQPTHEHQNSKADTLPHTLEVWFAGTHSDIGGGNVRSANLDRSSPPLRWMVFEACAAGLRTKPFKHNPSPIEITESLKGAWWILECLPLQRLTYTRNELKRNETTHKPHMGKPRKIHVGQKIHGSLILMDKARQKYTPKARPIDDDPDFWTKFRGEGLLDWKAADLFFAFEETTEIVEHVDPTFAQMESLVDRFVVNQDSNVWDTLRKTAMTVNGRQAVYQAMAGALQSIFALPKARLPTKVDFIANFMAILDETGRQATPLTKLEAKPIWEGFADFRESENRDYIDIAKTFLRCFTTAKPPVDLMMHQNQDVISVAVFPDDTGMVAALSDCTIRGWNTATGNPIPEYSYQNTGISNVVIVAPNGKFVVSGSQDGTVCLWNVETRVFPLKGHTGPIKSLAFSPDGMLVASGSEDKTIRVWDIDRKIQVGEPVTGHESTGNAVGFSADGRRVVSCSLSDKTVRVWDIKTGLPIAPVPLSLGGEDDWLLSAALSSDGRHLAAGFSDKGVRIWDLEKGRKVGKSFQAHEADVYTLAFSPDNKKIVSGSTDGTVLVWDVETQKSEIKFQYGTWVKTVAFFPNGKQVVAGCADGIIRIRGTEPWD